MASRRKLSQAAQWWAIATCGPAWGFSPKFVSRLGGDVFAAKSRPIIRKVGRGVWTIVDMPRPIAKVTAQHPLHRIIGNRLHRKERNLSQRLKLKHERIAREKAAKWEPIRAALRADLLKIAKGRVQVAGNGGADDNASEG